VRLTRRLIIVYMLIAKARATLIKVTQDTTVFLALLWLSIPLAAQQRYISSDVENGSRLYRLNCFACHGPEGASIPGVDFRRGQFKRASSDEDLFRTIRNGIPGTSMPPHNLGDAPLLALVGYLRNLHDSAASAV